MSVGGASDLNAIITTPTLVALFMNTKSTAFFFLHKTLSFTMVLNHKATGSTVALPRNAGIEIDSILFLRRDESKPIEKIMTSGHDAMRAIYIVN